MIPSDCIPFRKDFIPKIERGEKTMTTRSTRYEPGNIYRTVPGGVRIFIFSVFPVMLGVVAEHYSHAEGCESPADFIAVWKSLHRGRFNPMAVRWAHEFRLAKPLSQDIKVLSDGESHSIQPNSPGEC